MAGKEEKYTRRRLRSSYITTVISISLVLFMLGLMSFLILNTRNLSNYVKENIGFSIYLNDEVKEVDIVRIQKIIDASDFAKESKVVTKDEAAKQWLEETGEDFYDVLDFNPLPGSIDVKLKAEYANLDSIEVIKKQLYAYDQGKNQIREIDYQEDLIANVQNNVNKISLFILAFSALLFIISFALINNTIRLSVYSKRFNIKTMKLVGATRGFIRRPFIFNGVLQGVYSAMIAILLLSAVIYYLHEEFKEIISLEQLDIIGLLFLMVLVMGVLITWISTYFSVNKYLNIKEDKLYF
ncbi:MAG: cell division protein FtsX [Bacteroidetes bacterium GWF2_38_335]|nr:MAG: cell division protein FtsX [Bacteroidetes bacterium GWF2_38_335]HBS85821.1 cell division protein FtsX [Bacteroidales bacterium]